MKIRINNHGSYFTVQYKGIFWHTVRDECEIPEKFKSENEILEYMKRWNDNGTKPIISSKELEVG